MRDEKGEGARPGRPVSGVAMTGLSAKRLGGIGCVPLVWVR